MLPRKPPICARKHDLTPRLSTHLSLFVGAVQVLAPRLLQAVFSAVGDIYTYKLCGKLFGRTVARWAVCENYSVQLQGRYKGSRGVSRSE